MKFRTNEKRFGSKALDITRKDTDVEVGTIISFENHFNYIKFF